MSGAAARTGDLRKKTKKKCIKKGGRLVVINNNTILCNREPRKIDVAHRWFI